MSARRSTGQAAIGAAAAVLAALIVVGCSWATEIGLEQASDGGTLDGALDAARPDGEVPECRIATCAGRVYECGNCLDDDRDGRSDAEDSACVGACDDTEDRYDIALLDTPSCEQDCYYDADQGSGNDGCSQDSRCDPLSPDAPICPHDPGVSCPSMQSPRCGQLCGPLVPNGCDCFGCCELPSGSGQWIFLGGVDSAGQRTCAPETVGDPAICRRCTPNPDCLNECEACEICVGRPAPDAECAADGGNPATRCPDGVTPCGLPGDPLCPSGEYCLTGCCHFFG